MNGGLRGRIEALPAKLGDLRRALTGTKMRRVITAVKDSLLATEAGRSAYAFGQERRFEWDYRRRRERYEAQANDGELPAIELVRAQITKRGYTIRPRALGEVHTFAYIPGNWPHQNHIARALEALGPVTRFDYTTEGFELRSLRTREPGSSDRRRALLDKMLSALRAANQRRPVDWFISYALGWDISADTLSRIHEELGIPTVNISLDDKNWWDEIERGDRASGLRNVAPHFDLGWTSARLVLPWYAAEGGRAVFLPEGVDIDWFRPMELTADIDVGFVGNNFGHRPRIIRELRRAGIRVVVYGNNWPSGQLPDDEMVAFFNRCRINLGMGEMHFSRTLTNLKGRDFEAPATGRGIYMTSFNSDLARHFSVGHEIECYRGVDEMIELIRMHLRDPDGSREMARLARQRCIREHQWKHRHAEVLRMLGVLSAPARPDGESLDGHSPR